MATIPSWIKQKYPSISWDAWNNSYTSNTPIADWAGFHRDMAGGQPGNAGLAAFTVKQGGITQPTTPALPDFSVIKTVKQPEIAGATGTLLQQVAAQQKQTSDSLLKALPDLTANLDRSYAATQAATDTSKVEGQLTSSMAGEEAARRKLADDQGVLNRNYAKETTQLLDKLTAQLNEGEAASKATAESAAAMGRTRASLIPLINNPDVATTRSGNLTSREIAASIQAMLPVTERFAERRYLQTANIEQPLRRELFQNDAGLINAKSSLEREFGGNWRQIHQYIQGLKQQTAQMGAADAERYIAARLQLIGVPAQLLSGEISNLARLQQLDALANEYTFATPYQDTRLPEVQTPYIAAPQRNYTPQGGDAGMEALLRQVLARGGTPTATAPAYRSPEWYRQQVDARGNRKYSDALIDQYTRNAGLQQPPLPRPRYELAADAGIPQGGGFVSSGGNVTASGALRDMDWNASYDRGFTPQEQAYYEAIQRSYQ